MRTTQPLSGKDSGLGGRGLLTTHFIYVGFESVNEICFWSEMCGFIGVFEDSLLDGCERNGGGILTQSPVRVVSTAKRAAKVRNREVVQCHGRLAYRL